MIIIITGCYHYILKLTEAKRLNSPPGELSIHRSPNFSTTASNPLSACPNSAHPDWPISARLLSAFIRALPGKKDGDTLQQVVRETWIKHLFT